MKYLLSIFVLCTLLLTASSSAAGLVVSDVVVPEVSPGSEALITLEIENTFERDVEDVSFSLNMRDLPLSIVGSSESTIEEIEEDESEDLSFRIRASPTAKPGDYQIPFTLTYLNATQPKTGTIGVRIKGNVELSTSLTTNTPVVGRSDRLGVKIINKGFADARYVTVRLIPTDFTLHSDEVVYIGDISANDFETATFDVRYTEQKPIATVSIEYRDFNNTLQTITLQEQLPLYTEEEAVRRGIIEKSKTPLYISGVVAVVLLWLLWRMIRRRRRLRKSMAASSP